MSVELIPIFRIVGDEIRNLHFRLEFLDLGLLHTVYDVHWEPSRTFVVLAWNHRVHESWPIGFKSFVLKFGYARKAYE